jgi:hypothetical protein
MSEGTERGFFTSKLQNGTFDDGPAEKWTQGLEDRALETLIHAPNQCFVWTTKNRRHMAEYWALLFVRATAAFEFHRTSWEKSLSETHDRIRSDGALLEKLVQRYSFLCGRFVSDREILDVYSRVIPNLRSEAEMRSHYVQQLQRRTELFSELLVKKPWQVWIATEGSEFVTSDSPIMTLRLDEWGRYYVGDGFGKEGVVALLPLCPEACLFAGIQGYPSKSVTSHDVWEIDKVVISSSYRFTYSRNRDDRIDALMQERGGSIRYGVDAFKGDFSDEILGLLL